MTCFIQHPVVRFMLSASVCPGALLAAATAHAQEGGAAAQSETAAEERAPGFEEIVVVARRKEEQLQNVPVAVTAIAGADLARQSVVSLSDLTRTVPSLQVLPSAFSANIPRFVIRAQSQFEPLFSQDPSVAVYFADVIQARAHGLNGAMYDLASVQVLKGPQGTLFGRNSTGGAILIVPQAPTDSFEGYVATELGDYGLRSFEGAVNVPLSDAIQIRLSGRTYAHRGYTRGIGTGIRYDDADNYSLRLGIKAKLSDRLTNTLFVTNFAASENGTAFKLFNARSTLSSTTLGQLALGELASSRTEPFHSVRTAIPADSTDVKTLTIANTTAFDLDDVTIKNIFGYRRVRSTTAFDYDGTTQNQYNGTVNLRGNQYSNELQISGSSFGGALEWIGGGYLFMEKGTERQNTLLDYRPTFIQNAQSIGRVKNESQSLFAQATLKIPGLDGLSATAGLRYTWDQREIARTSFNNGNCALLTADVGGTPLSPCVREAGYKADAPTWTLGLDWQISPDHLLYVASRKGYRSGGVNQRANIPAQFAPFEPEFVTDYEIGLKADWHIGGGTLRTNLAFFHQDYEDIQRTQTQTVSTGSSTILITRVVNAASARVRGFEADILWSPIRAIQIRGYYSLADAKYKSWLVPIVGGGVQDRSGFMFANTPKHSGGGSILLRHELAGNAGEATAQFDVYTQSKTQLSDDNILPEGINPGYTTMNARLEWRQPFGQPLDLGVWVRNIADKKYYTSGVSVAGAGLGYTVKTIGAPRTIGISARYEF